MYSKKTSKKIHTVCDLVISVSMLFTAVSLIIWFFKG